MNKREEYFDGAYRFRAPGCTVSKKASPEVFVFQMLMRQTGNEAGRTDLKPGKELYVGTSKSYNINRYLESDGKDFRAKGSKWEKFGYDQKHIKKDIKLIDRGMKPLPADIRVSRYVYGEQLGIMLGDSDRINNNSINGFISDLRAGDKNVRNEFRSMLASTVYNHKGYVSTTYVRRHPSFDLRSVRLDLVVKRGTKAIMTNNHTEHEVLLQRDLKLYFTGRFCIITTRKGVDQLVIEACAAMEEPEPEMLKIPA